MSMNLTQTAPVALPRVAITFCTQCRWMLRAAYFGQELLSTFGTQIGEIALIPATGGIFTVELVRYCFD
jgi:selT/selW/selH-like putative selenoprotein